MIEEEERTCIHCHTAKTWPRDFAKSNKARGGVGHVCKECDRARNAAKARRLRPARVARWEESEGRRDGDTLRECRKCLKMVPASSMPPGFNHTWCRACVARYARARRAGVKEGACPLCSAEVTGEALCGICADAVRVLGGLEGMKRAVRAVRFLTEE